MAYECFNLDGPSHPLVMIQPWYNEPEKLERLAAAIGSHRPLYGLLPPPRAEADRIRSLNDFTAFARRALAETGLTPPYHIFGWSFGGRLAMELAAEMGDDVEFVGLLDTWLSPALKPALHLHYLLQTATVIVPAHESTSPQIWRRYRMWWRLYRKVAVKGIRFQLNRARSLGHRLPCDWDALEQAVYRAIWLSPQRSVGQRVSYFTATGTVRRQKIDPILDWLPYFTGGFDHYWIPGDHETIWDPENIAALSSALEAASDRIVSRRLLAGAGS